MTIDTQLKNVQNFLLNIDNINKQLNNWYKPVNFFEISGMVNKEIKHSRVLAWALDANATHGLGDAIVRRFLQKVIQKKTTADKIDIIDVSLFDYKSFVVKNEWNNIDILLVSEKEKAVIVIENKVYAKERTSGDDGGQLNKYKQIIEREYKDYKHKIFIFLTRESVLPSDAKHWITTDYTVVTDAIDEALHLAENLQTDAKIVLEHYILMVRRHLIVDEKLKEICKKIWQTYGSTLDLLNENRPDTNTEIFDYFKDYVLNNFSDSIYSVEEDRSKYLRFITPFVEKIFPKTVETDYGWGNGYRFMYEIEISYYGVIGTAKIVKPDDENCLKLFKLSQSSMKKKVKSPRAFETIYSKLILSPEEIKNWNDDKTHKLIEQNINEFMSSLNTYEANISDYLQIEN